MANRNRKILLSNDQPSVSEEFSSIINRESHLEAWSLAEDVRSVTQTITHFNADVLTIDNLSNCRPSSLRRGRISSARRSEYAESQA